MAKRKRCRVAPFQDDYYMGMACWAAAGTHNPNRQVGAAVLSVNLKNWACGTDIMPFGNVNYNVSEWDERFIVHAEQVAINNFHGVTQGGTLYVTNYPCCIPAILDAGIYRVVYIASGKKENWDETCLAVQGKINFVEYTGNLNWMRDYIKLMEFGGLFN